MACTWMASHNLTVFAFVRAGGVLPRLALAEAGGNGDIGVTVGIIVLAAALTYLLFFAYQLNVSQKKTKWFNELRKAFLDAEDTATYLKDGQLRFAFANHSFEKLSGIGENEIIGKLSSQVLPAAFSEMVLGVEREALENMSAVSDDVEWEGRAYKVSAFPVSMPDGGMGVGVYLRDTTLERTHMKLQQRLLKRNEILIDMLSGSFESKQEQIDYMLTQALALTESKYACIIFYDDAKGEFTECSLSESVVTDFGLEDTNVVPFYLADVCNDTIKTRKPVILNDYQSYLTEKGKSSPVAPHPIRFLSVPVIMDGRIHAVAGMADRESDYFGNAAYEATLLMNSTWNALERRVAQEKLILERNKYLQTILSIGDGVMVVNKQGEIDMLNTVAETLTGWSLSEAHGKPYSEVFVLSNITNPAPSDPIRNALDTETIQTLESDAVLTSRDGTLHFLEDSAAPIRDDVGGIVGAVLVFRDITDKREQRGRIEYLSTHDSLTGLYNRRYFEDKMLSIDTSENLPISIIMGDVNDLKLTNDIFGHSAGDRYIQHSAGALENVCRKGDIAARWGGDEFVLLLPKTSKEEAALIVERIHNEMSTRRVYALQCSMSLGYDVKTNIDDDVWHVLSSAEQRMYAEKTTGRSRLQEGTLDAFVQTLYDSAPREKEHAERTSAYCDMIGRAMSMPEDDLRKLKYAGMLHDIGKIVLESDLVSKTSAYTESEASEMKKHASVGYRILNSFDSTLNLAEAVLSHHERYDGHGYPTGLKGMQIPLLARIISVAESYERITRDFAGVSARPIGEALHILQENAGSQFDPFIVKLFVDLIKEGELREQE